MPHTTSRQEKSQSFHRCAVMRVSDDAAWFMTPNVEVTGGPLAARPATEGSEVDCQVGGGR